MHAHAGRAAILLMLALLGTVAGNRAVHATPAAAGATPPPLWQPPEPQAVPTPADGPFLHYELRDPGTQAVTVVEVDRYETTLLINGKQPQDWYSQLADPAHIVTLLEQAQTGPLRDHYAPLGTVPAIQQTLVYTQDQQTRTITFDATSHTPAPPAMWDLVAALRRIGQLPALTGTPSGPPLPATITYETVATENVVQVDAQGIARLYIYHQYRGGMRLTPQEIATIQTQIATAHFADLKPIYSPPALIGGQPDTRSDPPDPPQSSPDGDFPRLLVTQNGQSSSISALGSAEPPQFQRLVDIMSEIDETISARCHSPEWADQIIGYQLSTPTGKWEMGIDINGGIHAEVNAAGTAAVYLDPTDLRVLLQRFQQAQFDQLGGWYPATTDVALDLQHSVEIAVTQEGRYKGTHAETSSQVPAGLQALLEDLADLQTQAQASQQRAITNGTCPARIHLNRASTAGPAPGMPTAGVAQPTDLWLIVALALALTGLGGGVRRRAATC